MSFSTTAFYGGQLLTWLLKILPADLKDPSSPTDIPPCRLAVFLFASLVKEIVNQFPRLQKIFSDGGYEGKDGIGEFVAALVL